MKKSGMVGASVAQNIVKPSGRGTADILAAAAKLPSFKRSGLVGSAKPDVPQAINPATDTTALESQQLPGSNDSTRAANEPALPMGVHRLIEVHPSDLLDSPFQLRLRYDEGELANLAESLKLRQIEPLLVRPSKTTGMWEIISGHRRKRAAEMAEISLKAWVVSITDAEARVLVVAANDAAADCTDFERARAYQSILSDGELASTQKKLASLIGISEAMVSKRLGMLDTPKEVQEVLHIYPDAFSCGFLPQLHRIISKPYDPDLLVTTLTRVATGELNLSAVASIMAGKKSAANDEGSEEVIKEQSMTLPSSLTGGSKNTIKITPNVAKKTLTIKASDSLTAEQWRALIKMIGDGLGVASPELEEPGDSATTPGAARN